MEAVKYYGGCIRYIKDPCKDAQMRVVKQNGENIQYN